MFRYLTTDELDEQTIAAIRSAAARVSQYRQHAPAAVGADEPASRWLSAETALGRRIRRFFRQRPSALHPVR
jgi:hypothetical protein